MLNFRNFLLAWFYALCISICQAYDLAAGERIIQTLEDIVNTENFTYYRLQRDGQLKLILYSLEGDVDMFASSEVKHPTFYDYEMKSATCGVDVITVPFEMPRPVYIGLYGHPRYLHSRFSLSILAIPRPNVVTYDDLVEKYDRYYYDGMVNTESYGDLERDRESTPTSDGYSGVQEDDMPIWWKILLGIIEFGIEVIL